MYEKVRMLEELRQRAKESMEFIVNKFKQEVSVFQWRGRDCAQGR